MLKFTFIEFIFMMQNWYTIIEKKNLHLCLKKMSKNTCITEYILKKLLLQVDRARRASRAGTFGLSLILGSHFEIIQCTLWKPAHSYTRKF